jgi:hypothetical protein
VERRNQFFVTRNLLQSGLDFDIPVCLPKFSFVMVDYKDVFDAFMAVKLDASCLDGIPLSFVKMLLLVVLPALSSLPDGSALLCYQLWKFLTLRVSLIFVRLVFLPVCPRFVRC